MIRGKLAAQVRDVHGSRPCAKLRAGGHVPGNVYGHKEDNQAVSAKSVDVLNLVKAGIRVVDMEIGGKTTITVLKEVQWDSMGDFIQHFDLVRVDPDERVNVDVHVELRGTAPGLMSGGVIEWGLRSLHCECPVAAIPDAVVVKAALLDVGVTLHVKELELPPNVTVVNDPELVVVRCIKPSEAQIAAADALGGPAQPEVIGKKPDEKSDDKDAAKKK